MWKDYSRQPGEQITAWLLQWWDNGSDSQQLESKEAQQLGSLARNWGIKRGIGKEAETCRLWRWLLSSVKARYPFKEDLVNSPRKWTTAYEGIQYLRELAVLEVIYSDLDNDEVSKDAEDVLCTQAMWRKVIQSAPSSYSNRLAAIYCPDMDTPNMERVSWLQNFEENLFVEATEGEGESSQFAQVKAIQLALGIAEQEKWPVLYTDSWMVANALWGCLQQWKKTSWQHRGKPIWAAALWQDITAWVENMVLKVHHVDAHMPKSHATEEHQNNEQVDKAAKIEVAQVDLDWERKGELFVA
uniref:RNase H type-1 domain-containing protein n=1 Tax=Aquila chrysaetos chrysaetos TaxID=223781 RepID=A0A663E8Z5_AQUCH